jgi:enoyl-CoA hydratase/carnithine racemase
MSDLIVTRRREAVLEIVFNRPDKRNAINWPMMMALDAALIEAEKASGLRAVVLRGEGNGFCAGIDVGAFPEAAEHFGEGWRENLFPLTEAYQAVANRLERLSLPTIAMLHGYCLGLGFELALACDFRVAAEGTRLGLPEARLGIIPDVGGTTRLVRLVGAGRAKEIIMTGKLVDLAAAERWGILNGLVQAEELQARVEGLIDDLAQAAPLAVSHAKRVINGMFDVEGGLQLEGWAQAQLMRSQDFEVGVQAMLTRQPPAWTGR